MGKLFTGKVGKVLTRLLGNYLTEALGKVLDIYIRADLLYHNNSIFRSVGKANKGMQYILEATEGKKRGFQGEGFPLIILSRTGRRGVWVFLHSGYWMSLL